MVIHGWFLLATTFLTRNERHCGSLIAVGQRNSRTARDGCCRRYARYQFPGDASRLERTKFLTAPGENGRITPLEANNLLTREAAFHELTVDFRFALLNKLYAFVEFLLGNADKLAVDGGAGAVEQPALVGELSGHCPGGWAGEQEQQIERSDR